MFDEGKYFGTDALYLDQDLIKLPAIFDRFLFISCERHYVNVESNKEQKLNNDKQTP